MGLLDDVMVNVKSAANSVGKKTNEIVDYSKLRFTASGLNNEIRKKYQTLGEEVYTKCGAKIESEPFVPDEDPTEEEVVVEDPFKEVVVKSDSDEDADLEDASVTLKTPQSEE